MTLAEGGRANISGINSPILCCTVAAEGVLQNLANAWQPFCECRKDWYQSNVCHYI